MAKKKSIVKGMFNMGATMGVQSVALASFPDNPVTPKVLEGYGTFAGAFPLVGKIAGTTLVIKHAKNLIKKTKF